MWIVGDCREQELSGMRKVIKLMEKPQGNVVEEGKSQIGFVDEVDGRCLVAWK